MEKTVAEWSKFTGIKIGTINSRIYKGWTMREVIENMPAKEFSNNKDEKISKNDGEVFLNELEKSSIHCSLFPLVKKYHGKQQGKFLRDNHRAAFDNWYDTVFYPEQMRRHAALAIERSKIQQSPI